MLVAGRLGKLVGALAASLLPACSLVGLDELGYVRCSDDEPCERLSAAQGLDLDGCTGWQCSAGYCRLVERDADRDGAVRAVCIGGGLGDCDDEDASIHPGAMETCDGRDQDCDLALDEDVAAGIGDEHFVAVAALPASVRLVGTTSAGGGVSLAFVDDARRGLFEHVTSVVPFTPAPPLEPSLVPELGESPLPGRCALGASSTAIPIDDACGDDGDCAGALVCRPRADGRRVCGSFAGTCATDAECADGSLCNGAERCVPGAPEADVRGCGAPLVNACGAGDVCDERAAACHPTRPCDVVELAAAPADGDRWIAASISSHCGAGSLRVSELDRGASALRTTGGVIRTTAFYAVDPDADDCTGASRAGAPGATSLAMASLSTDPFSQALVAYRTGPSADADIEVVGAWLERDALDETWVSLAQGGVPVVLPTRPSLTAERPAVAAFRSTGAAGYVVAYAGAGGGVAIHHVPALPPPAADCPIGPPPIDVCIAARRTMVPETASAPRTTPAVGAPSSDLIGTEVARADVALAVRPSGAADAVVALAYATTEELVVRIGALNDGTFDFATAPLAAEHRLAAAGARDVSIAWLGAGLSVPNPWDVPEGGLVVAWRDDSRTWVARLRDGRPPTTPTAIGEALAGPRAAYLDGSLVVVGHRPGEIDVVPLTCPVPTR